MAIQIQFSAGESRHVGHKWVNYMIECPLGVTEDISDLPLYAECGLPHNASEDYGYFALKAEIIRQAEACGLDGSQLEFFYKEDSERCFDPDAKAEVEVEGW
jgi:hypothetical protein